MEVPVSVSVYVAVGVVLVGIVVLAALRLSRRLLSTSPAPALPRCNPSKVETKMTGLRYLVIGGHGFLGSHIVEGLLARGEEDVHVFDAVDSPLFRNEPNVSFIKGDILNEAHLENACSDRDVVFHTAAMLNYWSRLQHDFDLVNKVNYVGTKNVISACHTTGVKKLLFPSSATIFVTAETLHKPIHGLSEDKAVYPKEPLCHYTRTKMLAEQAVLAANGHKGLLTGVIRPNAIYGPRDLFSKLIGTGYPGVGTLNNKQDYAYVENVIHAFFKLEEALAPGSPTAGQAYFISDDAPIKYFTFASQFGREFGHTFRIIPHYVATVLGHIVELLTRLTNGRLPLGQLQVLTPPTLVVSRAEYYFSVDKAKRDLNWRPLFTPQEGITLSVRYHTSAAAAAAAVPSSAPTTLSTSAADAAALVEDTKSE